MRAIAKLQRRKRVFTRLANQARYDRTRRFYAREVFMCDEDIARLLRRRLIRTLWIVNLLVLAFILSSCATTVRGIGQGISGIGQGTGTIVKGVGDYLQEEMEGK